MNILDGKELSVKILEKIKKEIAEGKMNLSLAVVQVGENPVSKAYINQKEKICKAIGITFILYRFPKDITTEKLKVEIQKISENSDISGIIIQLPLPKKIDSQEALNAIPLEKDIDCLSEESFGKFSDGDLAILPPVVGAVSKLLREYKIKIKGKNVVLVGAGKLVGRPLMIWFSHEGAVATVVDKKTKNPESFTKKADILISGVGRPNLITGSMIKKGAVVIDAGTAAEKGKIKGDVDFKSVSKKASYITPVPGGVGPMTVACLIENLVILNREKKN
jgi:methylenetetrahydrofolate dehydrogenase (NADP+)/methenyltetrahydrofolate cyclohydrolase